jgi:hypothetical protein
MNKPTMIIALVLIALIVVGGVFADKINRPGILGLGVFLMGCGVVSLLVKYFNGKG